MNPGRGVILMPPRVTAPGRWITSPGVSSRCPSPYERRGTAAAVAGLTVGRVLRGLAHRVELGPAISASAG